MNHTLINADDLLLDSFRLAVRVFESGFRPDFLVGLWRGGSAVGIAVQEGLDFLGIETDHIAIRTSYTGRDSYSERLGTQTPIRVHGLRYLFENLEAEHSLLIVDDVYSTGSSVDAVIRQLAEKTRRNLPHDIRTAAVWHRPTERTIRPPDFYIHETEDWLVLPYELTGMTLKEIGQYKLGLDSLVDELRELAPDAD